MVATAIAPLRTTERIVLGWAGLRGAVPVVLATFPIIEGVPNAERVLQHRVLRGARLDAPAGLDVHVDRGQARRADERAGAAPRRSSRSGRSASSARTSSRCRSSRATPRSACACATSGCRATRSSTCSCATTRRCRRAARRAWRPATGSTCSSARPRWARWRRRASAGAPGRSGRRRGRRAQHADGRADLHDAARGREADGDPDAPDKVLGLEVVERLGTRWDVPRRARRAVRRALRGDRPARARRQPRAAAVARAAAPARRARATPSARGGRRSSAPRRCSSRLLGGQQLRGEGARAHVVDERRPVEVGAHRGRVDRRDDPATSAAGVDDLARRSTSASSTGSGRRPRAPSR